MIFLKRHQILSMTIVIVVIFLTGCNSSNAKRLIDSPKAAEVVKSEKDRITTPSVSKSDLSELTDGNKNFALDLYQQLREEEGNLFFSPYSISLALAMTYAGAQGETEKQMASVLHYTLPQTRLHPAFNALDLELASRGEGAKGIDGKGFRLNIANGLWGQKGYSFLPKYLDTLAENYGAELWLLDFVNQTEGARKTINDWVSEQTEEKIKDLLSPGAIDNLTRLILTNAIYFNAAWQSPFQESQTGEGPFHLLNGSKVTVPMMKQTSYFRYAKGEKHQAIELLYDGKELSMVIFLPNEGKFKEFEKSLNANQLETILNKISTKYVELTFPRFTYKSSFSLKKNLTKMGMRDAFSTEVADFSGMDGTRNLNLMDIVHEAFVLVNEAGTEAAAATAVLVATDSVPPPPLPVKIDRPFLFIIRDMETGTLLFLGRVVHPKS